jgi:hypothetical protein
MVAAYFKITRHSRQGNADKSIKPQLRGPYLRLKHRRSQKHLKNITETFIPYFPQFREFSYITKRYCQKYLLHSRFLHNILTFSFQTLRHSCADRKVVNFTDLYLKEDEMGRHVALMGEGNRVYRVFVGRPEGKRPLGRPRLRWKNNIGMNLGETGIDGENWIKLA